MSRHMSKEGHIGFEEILRYLIQREVYRDMNL